MTSSHESKVCFYARHLPPMFKALQQNKATVNKRVLKCIFWGLNQQAASLELDQNEKKILKKIAEECSKSEDPGLTTTAIEILKLNL